MIPFSSPKALAPIGLATLIFAASCTPIAVDEGADSEWHQVRIEGRPAGFLRVTESALADGGFRTSTRLKLRFRRGDTPLEIEAREEIEEDAAGKVRGFVLEQKLAQRTLLIHGRARGGQMSLSVQVGDQPPRDQSLPFDPASIGPHRAEALLRDGLLAEGDRVDMVVYSSELLRSTRQSVVCGPVEETPTPDGPRRLRRLTQSVEALASGPITLWVDDGFEQVKSSFQQLGLEMETFRTTREIATRAESGSPPEVFFSTSVPSDRPIPPTARRARYRLSLRRKLGEGRSWAPLADAAHQETLPGEANAASWTIEARRTAAAAAASHPAPSAAAVAAAYLSPSALIQSEAPEIRQAAAAAVAGASGCPDRAIRLERWVHDNVGDKNLDTAFASALEVLERREGDCTEHAVLLAALARAAGLPSRVVAGLLFHSGSFVGHMWCEVHCGTWIALDATIGAGEVGPDHIALAASSLEEGTAAGLLTGLLPVLGNVEVEVLEVE